MKNSGLLTLFLLLLPMGLLCQQTQVNSPDGKICVQLFNTTNSTTGEWYLAVSYPIKGKVQVVIPRIDLGLVRSDQDFSKGLTLLKSGNPVFVQEDYFALHGKRSHCHNEGNEITLNFQNGSRSKLNLIIRAYNDGLAFRYEFPEKTGSYTVVDEITGYHIPSGTKRWMEKWDLGNEALYTYIQDESIQQSWSYPALFNTVDSSCWYLLHEADLNRNYCGSKLSNLTAKDCFKITFPDPGDGNGASEPTISMPWKSPWRVIIMGSLADIVESTLIDDVSTPSVIQQTDWIRPGIASWNYWSNNHGTKDYQVVCEFADLAAAMGWTYTLLDWEWDEMANGGNLEDALTYIRSKGVKPLMWYNSGAFKWVRATPLDRMLTHENRVKEFARLKELGVAGIKVDFFLSEKQEMIKYYLDILEDAAQYEMMVYFHGCLVPRGWSRTWPHLMTYEGIRGAEWYNNGPEFTTTASVHNSIIPFTRNVAGPMDYTPVTFTNSQFPHITSFGHELALCVLFESGIQHMADRPEGYQSLPDAPRSFLKEIPAAWDDTRLLDGFPGKEVIIARRNGNSWYVGGINAEPKEKLKKIALDFLSPGITYKLTLISDGIHDRDLTTRYMVVDQSDSVDVKLLRRGGFAASLQPVD